VRGERIFLDTWFTLALLNARDTFHAQAKKLLPRVRSAAQVITTEAVLVEVCNGLARLDRTGAAAFVKACYVDPRIEVVPVTRPLLDLALQHYSTALDKEWGLTDCISFAVMRQYDVQFVATGDHHFRQAGFIPLFDSPG
jgi:hypothetical protein